MISDISLRLASVEPARNIAGFNSNAPAAFAVASIATSQSPPIPEPLLAFVYRQVTAGLNGQCTSPGLGLVDLDSVVHRIVAEGHAHLAEFLDRDTGHIAPHPRGEGGPEPLHL